MLVSYQQLLILQAKGLVDYVYKFSLEEAKEHQISTYSKGHAQPYIDSIAGITFHVIIENQGAPKHMETHSTTINCSVVHNAAKPDFLIGTILIGNKGLIPLALAEKGDTRCLTLTRSTKIESDAPHQSAMRFLFTGRAQSRLWTHAEFRKRHQGKWESKAPQIEIDPVSSAIKRQKPDSPSDDSSFEVLYGPQSPETQFEDLPLSSAGTEPDDEPESRYPNLPVSDLGSESDHMPKTRYEDLPFSNFRNAPQGNRKPRYEDLPFSSVGNEPDEEPDIRHDDTPLSSLSDESGD
jgi:hypothetical protein